MDHDRDAIRALEDAEARLAELRLHLNPSVVGFTTDAGISLALAKRACNLYDGALFAAHVSPEGAMVILRSLTELAILLRWFEASPSLRIRLWLAEDDRLRMPNAGRFVELRTKRGLASPPLFDEDQVAAMQAEIQEAVAAAIAAGQRRPDSRRDSLLPPIEDMARKAPEGWEIYQIVYRTLNSHVHNNARSLVGDRFEQDGDAIYLISGSAWDRLHVRALAIQSVLVALAAGSRLVGLGIDRDCDQLRNGYGTWAPPVSAT